MALLEFGLTVTGAVALAVFAVLLPAIITGEWHKDRVERMIRGEFPGV